MSIKRTLQIIGIAASIFWVSPAFSNGPGDEIGTLAWTQRTGGSLTESEQIEYIADAIPGLIWASIRRIFPSLAPKEDLSHFAPPNSPIIGAAMNRLRESSTPAFVNHSIRLAYWTLLIMKRENPNLTQQEIEEVWMAALLHDIGLALPPASGEFTLGGVKVVSELASEYGWSKESETKASEAITLNPNGQVDREKFGLVDSG